MVSHLRKAFRRKSSIHCGSFFFAEMARTTFSSRPFGKVSLSMMVCQPGAYGLQHSHQTDDVSKAMNHLYQLKCISSANCLRIVDLKGPVTCSKAAGYAAVPGTLALLLLPVRPSLLS